MTAELPTAVEPAQLRSAFCCFWQKDRFKHEMIRTIGPSGKPVKRCTHCQKYNAPQAQKRI